MNEMSEPSGEVSYHRDGDGVFVDSATPTMWFARHTLKFFQENPHGEWAFDGTYLTLDGTNGRWVWKLTGRTWIHRYDSPTADPLVMCEARWPD